MSLRKCQKCGTYTLQDKCSKCNEESIDPSPPRFSLVHAQKYGKYRRELMKRAKEAGKHKQ